MTPEKLRALAMKLMSVPASHDEAVIDKWLEQNQPELVVGLSDEQIKDFSQLYGLTVTQQVRLNVNLTNFLKTQTFSQVRAFDDSELSEKYMTLYDDYQSLLVDKANTSQFEPNWDDVPVTAKYVRVVLSYLREDFMSVSSDEVLAQFERPKPKVTVGQVWKFVADDQDFTVSELAAVWVIDKFVGCIGVKNAFDESCFYSHEDFLAKFERVSSDG